MTGIQSYNDRRIWCYDRRRRARLSWCGRVIGNIHINANLVSLTAAFASLPTSLFALRSWTLELKVGMKITGPTYPLLQMTTTLTSNRSPSIFEGTRAGFTLRRGPRRARFGHSEGAMEGAVKSKIKEFKALGKG